ncbi:hypothetical protein VIBNIAM115_1990006 [Vibrio nigripulchritudo AM115]|nr:hypothetical protein VIBNIAM115_1990006 [Vibrio nigripulchritudo AM115]
MQFQKKGYLLLSQLSLGSDTVYVGFIKSANADAYGLGRRLSLFSKGET